MRGGDMSDTAINSDGGRDEALASAFRAALAGVGCLVVLSSPAAGIVARLAARIGGRPRVGPGPMLPRRAAGDGLRAIRAACAADEAARADARRRLGELVAELYGVGGTPAASVPFSACYHAVGDAEPVARLELRGMGDTR